MNRSLRPLVITLVTLLPFAVGCDRLRSSSAGEAALFAGSSHLLLAELRASQRRPIAAAFEAKKAKRLRRRRLWLTLGRCVLCPS